MARATPPSVIVAAAVASTGSKVGLDDTRACKVLTSVDAPLPGPLRGLAPIKVGYAICNASYTAFASACGSELTVWAVIGIRTAAIL